MKLVSLYDLKDNLEKTYDVFITSASFEERSLSVTQSIISDIKFKNKYVVAVLHNRPFIQKTIDTFVFNYNFSILDVDTLNQLRTVDNYLAIIETVLDDNPNASFLIDITTFTRQNLLILFRLLRNNLSKKKNKVHCLYSCASDYAIGLKEDEKWLSKGILSVNSVFGYAGIIGPSKPYHLIILMGYEVERASALIYEYEPFHITIGVASKESSLSIKHFEINKNRVEKLLEEFPRSEQFEFSCSEAKCKDEILLQANKYPDYNVVISPMNNKISTLCLASASFENKRIQIAIAIPMLYNYTGYSKPGTDCYIINANDLLLKKK